MSGTLRPQSRPTQSRGQERRARILRATLKLLETRDVDDITYSEVGHAARIPLGSLHFFYPNLTSIYAAIWDADNQAICERLAAPLRSDQTRTWRSIYMTLLDRGVRHMKSNPAIGKLLLSGRTRLETQRRDLHHHTRMATLFEQTVDAYIELPPYASRTRTFYVAIEIFALILTLSMLEHGRLVSTMIDEAKRASAAYLGIYFGDRLRRRPVPKPLPRWLRSAALR